MDTPLPTTQALFAAALLDPALGIAALLADSPACPPARTGDPRARFNVHRNTVITSLVRAMAEGFPSVERLVGPVYFAAMAAEFARTQPPAHPALLAWGAGLAAFLEDFAPVAHLPWLADVARLDGLRRRAWHAAEVPALRAESLAGADPERLADRRIALHPSVAVLGSPYPARTLWAAQNGDELLHPIKWVAEITLVRREGDAILVDAVDDALLALLDAARRQPTLAELLDADSEPDKDDADHANAKVRAKAFATSLRDGLLVDADALDAAMGRVPDATLFDAFLPPFPRSTSTDLPE